MDNTIKDSMVGLMLSEQRRQGVSQRLREEMQASFRRCWWRINLKYCVVTLCCLAVLAAAVAAMVVIPNGRDMAANGDRAAALATMGQVIAML